MILGIVGSLTFSMLWALAVIAMVGSFAND
jgi:4'-phosphopantetheinyl transferase EntD